MELQLITIVLVVLSIILHEVAHGYVANWLGDPTAKYAGRLTLNPLPHIDPIGSLLIPGLLVLSNASFLVGWAKPVPINPYNLKAPWGLPAQAGEALVAIAGPGTNVLIAIIFAMLVRFGGAAVQTESILIVVFGVIVANLSLAILNLIPIPPLDGSKVVAVFLPPGAYRSYKGIEGVTYMLGPFGLLVVLIIVFNLLSPFISQIVFHLFTLLTGITL